MFGLTAFAESNTFGAASPASFVQDPVVVFSSVGSITSSLGSTATTADALVISVNVGNITTSLGTHTLSISPTAEISGLDLTSSLISSLTPFTWTNISDTVGESWSAVSTTSTSESWTEVEEDTTDEATTWTDA